MMHNLIPLFGVLIILLLSFSISNNRKLINYKTVINGLLLQCIIALLSLKTSYGAKIFKYVGDFISYVIDTSSRNGADFVFGVLVRKDVLSQCFGVNNSFIFFFNIMATIVLICCIVSLLYHFGIMQKIVVFIARIVHKLMDISGSEAISNVGSIFVGQVEAQIMIKPFLKNMTNSELLASMSGSMACISGGVMIVYISLGIPAEYLLVASLMAAPGALVISKIVYPETEISETKGKVYVSHDKDTVNILDAISNGCKDGLNISLNLAAMLIGYMSLVSLLNMFFTFLGKMINIPNLTLQFILGKLFSFFALIIGIPFQDIEKAGSLLGTKLVINEFVAYLDLQHYIKANMLTKESIMLISICLCGFANFGSIGVQLGGIGSMVPSRIKDLSKLGLRALICGTLSSYLSAAIVKLICNL
jgi:CNT family concentrative nucleoside transporter